MWILGCTIPYCRRVLLGGEGGVHGGVEGDWGGDGEDMNGAGGWGTGEGSLETSCGIVALGTNGWKKLDVICEVSGHNEWQR
jgi:hypothetical protein